MSTVLVQGRELYGRLKREIAENVLSQSLMLLSHSSENNYRRLSATFLQRRFRREREHITLEKREKK
jgi:hypothetical protein